MTRDLKSIDAENAELRARVEALEARLNPHPRNP
jgi:BMFP domain-containing protein YqiC